MRFNELVGDTPPARFLEDRTLQLSAVYLIQIIGEATRTQHSEIPWRQAIGMRNRIAHKYFAVNLYIAWTVVTVDLPGLIMALEALLPREQA